MKRRYHPFITAFFVLVTIIGSILTIAGGFMLTETIWYSPENYVACIWTTILCLFFGIIFVAVGLSVLLGTSIVE